MTVKELIQSLSEFDDNKEVQIWHDDMGLVNLDYVAMDAAEENPVIYLKLN